MHARVQDGFLFGVAEAECRDLGSSGVVLDDWGASPMNEDAVPEHCWNAFAVDASPTMDNPRDKVLFEHDERYSRARGRSLGFFAAALCDRTVRMTSFQG